MPISITLFSPTNSHDTSCRKSLSVRPVRFRLILRSEADRQSETLPREVETFQLLGHGPVLEKVVDL